MTDLIGQTIGQYQNLPATVEAQDTPAPTPAAPVSTPTPTPVAPTPKL